MGQGFVNAVTFHCVGDIVRHIQNDLITVLHGNAMAGKFQHGQVVTAVTECIGVFAGYPEMIHQKLHAGGLGESPWNDLIELGTAVDEIQLLGELQMEAGKIALRSEADAEFVKGQSSDRRIYIAHSIREKLMEFPVKIADVCGVGNGAVIDVMRSFQNPFEAAVLQRGEDRIG